MYPNIPAILGWNPEFNQTGRRFVFHRNIQAALQHPRIWQAQHQKFMCCAGPLSLVHTELQGEGVAGGAPAEWNDVVLIPRDEFGNILEAAALAGQAVLASDPTMPEYRQFEVRLNPQVKKSKNQSTLNFKARFFSIPE